MGFFDEIFVGEVPHDPRNNTAPEIYLYYSDSCRYCQTAKNKN